MATETRTVTDEEKILAGVLVMEALEDFLWLPDEELERIRQDLTEQLLWTRRGRARLRRFAKEVVAAGEGSGGHGVEVEAVPLAALQRLYS